MFYRLSIFLGFMLATCLADAQELYVFSDPASNLPAKSVTVRLGMRLADNSVSGNLQQRYQPEIMAGLSKQVMVRVSTTFSDIYSPKLAWESVKGYVKWRFFSEDDIHRHFRMALFLDGAYANHGMVYEEMSLDGDNSGIQGGITGTQLLHKLAISSTVSLMRVFDEKFKSGHHQGGYDQDALNYSLSVGYLLFPKDYTDYNQVNINLYLELLGMKGLEKGQYYLDLAPAIQLIFNSSTKLNLGARIETAANMDRVARYNYFLSLETSFLNAFRSKGKKTK